MSIRANAHPYGWSMRSEFGGSKQTRGFRRLDDFHGLLFPIQCKHLEYMLCCHTNGKLFLLNYPR